MHRSVIQQTNSSKRKNKYENKAQILKYLEFSIRKIKNCDMNLHESACFGFLVRKN